MILMVSYKSGHDQKVLVLLKCYVQHGEFGKREQSLKIETSHSG